MQQTRKLEDFHIAFRDFHTAARRLVAIGTFGSCQLASDPLSDQGASLSLVGCPPDHHASVPENRKHSFRAGSPYEIRVRDDFTKPLKLGGHAGQVDYLSDRRLNLN